MNLSFLTSAAALNVQRLVTRKAKFDTLESFLKVAKSIETLSERKQRGIANRLRLSLDVVRGITVVCRAAGEVIDELAEAGIAPTRKSLRHLIDHGEVGSRPLTEAARREHLSNGAYFLLLVVRMQSTGPAEGNADGIVS